MIVIKARLHYPLELVKTHIFLSVRVRHAAIQSAVLKAPQITVIHQNIQDGCHLTEDQNLVHNKQTIPHTSQKKSGMEQTKTPNSIDKMLAHSLQACIKYDTSQSVHLQEKRNLDMSLCFSAGNV